MIKDKIAKIVDLTSKLKAVSDRFNKAEYKCNLANERFKQLLIEIGNDEDTVNEVIYAANDENNSVNLSSLLNFTGKVQRKDLHYNDKQSENDQVVIETESPDRQQNINEFGIKYIDLEDNISNSKTI